MPNRVVHFEIQADDIERARTFYTSIFGWKIEKFSGNTGGNEYWSIMTAPMESTEMGISGGMLKRPCPPPKLEQGTNAYCCTISVENFDAIEKKILKAGGKTAMPKFQITTMMGKSWVGYFIDTESNVFGIIENTDYLKNKKK